MKQTAMYENNAQTEEPEDDPIDESTLPDGTPLSDSDIEILKDLNKKYAQVSFAGKNIIVSGKECPIQGEVYTFESPSDFKGKFWHKHYIGIGRQKNQGSVWLQWPGKNYLPNGAGFYPDPKKCPKGVFNFYRGFRVKPIEGDCTLYLDHLLKVICDGDEVSFNYLIGFLAHMVQQPDIKPSVAIVLKSVEGTGKGTMVSPVLKMLGSHGIQTNGAYAIAGRFNSSMANKLLAFCDEVEMIDKYLSDRIKALISESTVNLERKGLEIEPLPNYCRFIFASNHTRVINAGIRERRYLVLEPSADKAQDSDYFEKLWGWVNNGGSSKLLHYLMNVDISEFNPYKCPQTKALIAEKLDNLGGINRYFYNEIMLPEPFAGRARINAHELVEDFIKRSKEDDLKVNIASARSLTGKMMAKLNIEVRGRSDRGQGKYYDLPIRSELVQQFADFLDIPVKELEL